MNERYNVAKEAARLLYRGLVHEYKDAKELAASNLGVKVLPSNYEVALELDILSTDFEGRDKEKRLIEMRKHALKVMSTLKKYKPKLIGSVWRGTARIGSDIDILVYHDKLLDVEEVLKRYYTFKERNENAFLIDGQPRKSTNIKFDVNSHEVEVVLRPSSEFKEERCEIFGDLKKGISLNALEELMKFDPLRKFIPKRYVK